MSAEDKATEIARGRYNRIAPIYDLMEGFNEKCRFSRWRKLLWSKMDGPCILEVGVGSGKNFPYYPTNADVTAIDFSDKMLKQAEKKASKQKLKVRLQHMDVQDLKFGNDAFDTVVASFVFCSVPNPVRGLLEVERVCKPGGKVILLEHVLSAHPVIGWLMNVANPLVVRMTGANINRRTVDNVIESGLVIEHITDLGAGIFKLIDARKKTR